MMLCTLSDELRRRAMALNGLVSLTKHICSVLCGARDVARYCSDGLLVRPILSLNKKDGILVEFSFGKEEVKVVRAGQMLEATMASRYRKQ